MESVSFVDKKLKKIINRIRTDANDFALRWKKNVLYKKIALPEADNRSQGLCVFAHYSHNNIIDQYVVALVSAIQEAGCDVLFVSAGGPAQSPMEFDKLSEKVVGCILRNNIGYDFGSWKTGIDCYPQMRHHYSHIVFANDSVYGPFFDLKPVLENGFKASGVWSLTDSFERRYHLQSYFWGLNHDALESGFFEKFWLKDFLYYSDRYKVIREYELSIQKIASSQFSLSTSALFPIGNLCAKKDQKEKLKLNPTQDFALELFKDWGFPFVKRELLLGNPKGSRDLDKIYQRMRDGNEANFNYAIKHLGVLKGE